MNNHRRFGRITIMAGVTIALSLLIPLEAIAQPAAPRTLAPLLQADRDVLADEYIVVFNVGASPIFRPEAREELALARRQSLAAQDLVRRLGGIVRYQYNTALVGLSAKLSPEALEAVRAAPGVAFVETARRIYGDAARDVSAFGARGLDRMDQRLLGQSPNPPLNGWYTYNDTGNNIHVYVIDSGIYRVPTTGGAYK